MKKISLKIVALFAFYSVIAAEHELLSHVKSVFDEKEWSCPSWNGVGELEFLCEKKHEPKIPFRVNIYEFGSKLLGGDAVGTLWNEAVKSNCKYEKVNRMRKGLYMTGDSAKTSFEKIWRKFVHHEYLLFSSTGKLKTPVAAEHTTITDCPMIKVDFYGPTGERTVNVAIFPTYWLTNETSLKIQKMPQNEKDIAYLLAKKEENDARIAISRGAKEDPELQQAKRWHKQKLQEEYEAVHGWGIGFMTKKEGRNILSKYRISSKVAHQFKPVRGEEEILDFQFLPQTITDILGAIKEIPPKPYARYCASLLPECIGYENCWTYATKVMRHFWNKMGGHILKIY